ncbi:TPA_asm: P8 [Peat soil associated betacytorhabdovirus 2]|jgi:hypothetical protein|nr:TPA_asm: P8 [Peat soil associated betacytorhabdovirus 2]
MEDHLKAVNYVRGLIWFIEDYNKLDQNEKEIIDNFMYDPLSSLETAFIKTEDDRNNTAAETLLVNKQIICLQCILTKPDLYSRSNNIYKIFCRTLGKIPSDMIRKSDMRNNIKSSQYWDLISVKETHMHQYYHWFRIKNVIIKIISSYEEYEDLKFWEEMDMLQMNCPENDYDFEEYFGTDC